MNDVTVAAASRAGRYRWTICALLFAATAINYIDRQILGVLKPSLQAEMQWSEQDFASIVFWFQLAYALGYIAFGKVVDVLGARLGFSIAVAIWTVAHMAHGLASSITQFALARVGLGIGEAGNFPSGIKAVTEWFPQQERSFAIGIFNAGANVGAIITPLIVPIIVLAFDWRMAFYLTGLLGIIWMIAWWVMYRRPREQARCSAAELAWIESDPPDPVAPIAWNQLLVKRETWAYALGKFCIDPIWWFFLFWLPGYLFQRYNLDLKSFGLPLAAIYLLSDVGSVAGGWMSSRMIKHGWSVNSARKLTMLACAVCTAPIFFAQDVSSLWGAVLLIGLATAGHQAFSATLYTFPSDVFPRNAVGSVVGIGGTLGAIGGMSMALFTGYILESTHSYALLFAICATAYFLAVAIVHLLSPRLDRVVVSET
jgi:MFS transporter, ACS family, hexuronate transporter